MRFSIATAIVLFMTTAALGQNFYTPSITQKPKAGEYSTRWHYGRITFKVISYAGNGSSPESNQVAYCAMQSRRISSTVLQIPTPSEDPATAQYRKVNGCCARFRWSRTCTGWFRMTVVGKRPI